MNPNVELRQNKRDLNLRADIIRVYDHPTGKDSGAHSFSSANNKRLTRWLAIASLIVAPVLIALDAYAAKRPTAAPATASVNFPPYPPNMVYPVRVGIASHAPSARIAVWQPGAVSSISLPFSN